MLRSVGGALVPLSAANAMSSSSIDAYLEGKMLQEVSCAVGSVRFRARPSINPNTDRRRLRPRRVLSSNL
jgi:hypothetical protein